MSNVLKDLAPRPAICGMLLTAIVVVIAGRVGATACQLESGIYTFGKALRLLDAAYPDLAKEAEYVRIGAAFGDSPGAREIVIRVADRSTQTQGETNKNVFSEAALAHTTFVFDAEGLNSYFAHGRLVNDPENGAFCQRVRAHPEWSEAQVGVELEHRGALYPPPAKDTLMRELLPAPVLADVAIARSLTMVSARFVVDRTRGADHSELLAVGCARWEAVYRPSVGPATFEYRIEVEPFRGRLKAIKREPTQSVAP